MSDELTMRERKEIRARMKRFIAAGATDTAVMEATGWSQQRTVWARRNVLDDETRAVTNSTSLTTFAEFRIACESNIVDLDAVIKTALEAGQVQSAVMAIRTKQDIAESLIKRGQELGLIEKAIQRKALLVAGMNLSTLKPQEVKALVADQKASLVTLMSQLDKPVKDVTVTSSN